MSKPLVSGQDLRGVKIELIRRSFWQYCKNKAPSHYREDRKYLKSICNSMQDFIESKDNVLIVNAPPRHYKSFTATSLCEWWLGNNSTKKIMTGSYNETLSQTFSKGVRGTIETKSLDPSKIVYSDIFPKIKIKRGDGATNRWSLAGQHATYLATSPTGTATGFGADLIIVDDIIKSAYEANNAPSLEKQWSWFVDTMISRLEEGGKIIIVMTRWHSMDLAGRALSHFPSIGYSVRNVVFKALQDNGTMLCPDVLSLDSYKARCLTLSQEIASANYQQEPIDIKGKLYEKGFKTYTSLPVAPVEVYSYCDTADMGADYLCNIIYTEYNNEAYILDVYYTRDAMEITEKELANRLTDFKVKLAMFESNNGGRSFSRAVGSLLESVKKNYFTGVKWFNQTSNKQSRILVMSSWLQEHVYFPINWRDRWPDFYNSLISYQRTGKNPHDDAEDCLTAVAERITKPHSMSINI